MAEKPPDDNEKSAKLGDFNAEGGSQRLKTAMKLVKHNHPLRKTPVFKAFPMLDRLSWDHFPSYDLKVQIEENLRES